MAEANVVTLRGVRPPNSVPTPLWPVEPSSVEDAQARLTKLEAAVTLGLAVLAKANEYGEDQTLAALAKIYSATQLLIG